MSALPSDLRSACESKVLLKGSVLAASVGFLPDPEADGILALESLFASVRSIPVEVSDPGVAMAKLGWWQNELHPGTAPDSQHPMLQALNVTGTIRNVQGDQWIEYLAAIAASIDPGPASDQQDFQQSLQGSFGRECLMLSGESEPVKPTHPLFASGAAIGVLEHIEAVLAGSGGLGWLPMDLVARHQIQINEELSSMAPGKKHKLVQDLAGLALGWLEPVNEEWFVTQVKSGVGQNMRFLWVRSALTRRRLEQVKKSPDRVARSLGRASIAETFSAWAAARQVARWIPENSN